MIKRILKMIGLGIGLVVLLVVLGVLVFVNVAPQFGAAPSGDRLAAISKSPQYAGKAFENAGGVKQEMHASKMFKTAIQFFKGGNNRQPVKPLPVHVINPAEMQDAPDTALHVTWFGHSTVYMELGGKRIFIDPMLGPYAAPSSLLGPKRFPGGLPLSLDAVPELDFVLISHDHYDHLDYTSIVALHERTKQFLVPLGVGSHLEKWGVPASKIIELDWWEERSFGEFRFVSTPSQHFSGRGLTDRDKTLWCSWIIDNGTRKVFFSGDSGYFPGFAEIGEKEGPFDFAMMECGQYNEAWKEIHMMPEETYQAFVDVRGKVLMPIHWGAFNLALHSWTDPIDRVTAAAAKDGATVATPIVGETFTLGDGIPQSQWWKAN